LALSELPPLALGVPGNAKNATELASNNPYELALQEPSSAPHLFCSTSISKAPETDVRIHIKGSQDEGCRHDFDRGNCSSCCYQPPDQATVEFVVPETMAIKGHS
jgi:hypothetical protein